MHLYNRYSYLAYLMNCEWSVENSSKSGMKITKIDEKEKEWQFKATMSVHQNEKSLLSMFMLANLRLDNSDAHIYKCGR